MISKKKCVGWFLSVAGNNDASSQHTFHGFHTLQVCPPVPGKGDAFCPHVMKTIGPVLQPNATDSFKFKAKVRNWEAVGKPKLKRIGTQADGSWERVGGPHLGEVWGRWDTIG